MTHFNVLRISAKNDQKTQIPFIQLTVHPNYLPQTQFQINVKNFLPHVYIQIPETKTEQECIQEIKQILSNVAAVFIKAELPELRKIYYCGLASEVSLMKICYRNHARQKSVLVEFQKAGFSCFYGHVNYESQFSQITGIGEFRVVEIDTSKGVRNHSGNDLSYLKDTIGLKFDFDNKDDFKMKLDFDESKVEDSGLKFNESGSDSLESSPDLLEIINLLPDLIDKKEIDKISKLNHELEVIEPKTLERPITPSKFSQTLKKQKNKQNDQNTERKQMVSSYVYQRLAIVSEQTGNDQVVLEQVENELMKSDIDETSVDFDDFLEKLVECNISEDKSVNFSLTFDIKDVIQNKMLEELKLKPAETDYSKNCFNQTLGASQMSKSQVHRKSKIGADNTDGMKDWLEGDLPHTLNPTKAKFSGATIYKNLRDCIDKKDYPDSEVLFGGKYDGLSKSFFEQQKDVFYKEKPKFHNEVDDELERIQDFLERVNPEMNTSIEDRVFKDFVEKLKSLGYGAFEGEISIFKINFGLVRVNCSKDDEDDRDELIVVRVSTTGDIKLVTEDVKLTSGLYKGRLGEFRFKKVGK